MRELVTQLCDYWTHTSTQFNPGVTPDELEAFESANNVRLPSELREYYQLVNGTDGSDPDLLTFNRLDELESLAASYGTLPEVPASGYWFIIADYLISSHLYLVELRPTPSATTPVIFFNGARGIIADTFQDWLRAYLGDPDEAIFPTQLRGFQQVDEAGAE